MNIDRLVKDGSVDKMKKKYKKYIHEIKLEDNTIVKHTYDTPYPPLPQINNEANKS